jgi:hypothetical protein
VASDVREEREGERKKKKKKKEKKNDKKKGKTKRPMGVTVGEKHREKGEGGGRKERG